jgi:aryl-alcohol dehydrogenase-like predicted oxidoreductase
MTPTQSPVTANPSFSLPRVGLGCMGLSEFYGDVQDDAGLSALKAAVELGYRHFDTADMYGRGHNEQLLGRFLKHLGPQRRAELSLATKAGIVRDPVEKYKFTVRGDPAYLREACDASLLRLGVDHVDLYYVHRLSPGTPLEESLDTLAALVREGKIGAIGLCEVDAATLRKACAHVPVQALQSEYSIWSRDVETEILPATAELGVRLVAFSPIGRGFLSGSIGRDTVQQWASSSDLRTQLPRFQEASLDQNLRLVREMQSLAAANGLSAASLALAWVLAQGPQVTVIPGSRRLEHLEANFGASRIELPQALQDELRRIFSPEAVAGGRYPGANTR